MRVTLWSGRFDTAPDPAAFDFGISFGFDRVLFEDDVTGSLAWAEALGSAGVLSPDDTRESLRVLKDILDEGRRNPALIAGPDEDVHSFVEAARRARRRCCPPASHGRSRNEQVSLDLRCICSAASGAADGRSTTGRSMREPGGAGGRGAHALDTHFRRAQPVLLAHFFLSHASALRRDHARLAGRQRRRMRSRSGQGRLPVQLSDRYRASRQGPRFSRTVFNSNRLVVGSRLRGHSLCCVAGDGALEPARR